MGKKILRYVISIIAIFVWLGLMEQWYDMTLAVWFAWLFIATIIKD